MATSKSMTELVDKTTGEIIAFNPEETKQTIAKADALIDYGAKVKDATLIQVAVDEKVNQIMDFVHWWTANVSVRQGARTDLVAERGLSSDDVHKQTGISKQQVLRWRKSIEDDETFRRKILEAALKKANMLPADNHRAEGTGENEWYTPSAYIEAARRVMGSIDLDPASSSIANEVVKAEKFYTHKDNGLIQDWVGNIWLNPPYSRELIGPFMDKLAEQVGVGNVKQAIVLTHNYTDTAWFHNAESISSRICFTRGRVGFVSSSGEISSPTQGQAFFYVGDSPEDFESVFREYGFVR